MSTNTSESAAPYESVRAADVRPGDVLMSSGLEVEIVRIPRPGCYWFATTRRADGVAIDWKAGNQAGTMIREPGDILQRVRTAGAS